MSKLTEPVIPDESAYVDEIRNPVRVLYDQVLTGSGSRPSLPDLAGMTNYATVQQNEWGHVGILRS